MPINHTALATELNTDPLSLGYATLITSGNDQGLADLLNASRPGQTVERTTVPAYEVFEAIVPAEWASASAQEKQRVQTILSMGTVNLKGTNTRASLAAAFGPATTTRANLIALQTRQASRAEALFGAGTVVTASDVARALRGA